MSLKKIYEAISLFLSYLSLKNYLTARRIFQISRHSDGYVTLTLFLRLLHYYKVVLANINGMRGYLFMSIPWMQYSRLAMQIQLLHWYLWIITTLKKYHSFYIYIWEILFTDYHSTEWWADNRSSYSQPAKHFNTR